MSVECLGGGMFGAGFWGEGHIESMSVLEEDSGGGQ